MKSRKIENKLAYLGALIVLIGVTWAAGSAFGAEPGNVASASVANAENMDETIIGARTAIAEAAARANEALRAANKFDLDNQLDDLTSTLIARVK